VSFCRRATVFARLAAIDTPSLARHDAAALRRLPRRRLALCVAASAPRVGLVACPTIRAANSAMHLAMPGGNAHRMAFFPSVLRIVLEIFNG
jgi:hypothetical protein